MKARFADVFATKTRDEWAAVFEGTDACAAPVLSPWEADRHPHNKARGTFVEVEGIVQPAPAPGSAAPRRRCARPPSHPGADTSEALSDWGVPAERVARLREAGALS